MPSSEPRPGLRPQARALHTALLGGRPAAVPRWELFFDNPEIEIYFAGRPARGNFAAQVSLAREIGWGSVRGISWGVRIGARNETASDGTSRYAGGSALTWDDLDRLPQPDVGRIAEEYAANAAIARADGLLVHLFMLHCFHSAATGIGMERLCLMVYDEHELLCEYMRRVEAFNRRALHAVLDTGITPDIAIFDADCAFKTALMVNPHDYRALIFEPTSATADVLHDAGVIMLMHTDGCIDDVYPIWLEMGLAASHGVEAQANDLVDIKSRFGDRMTLIGNFDPVVLATAEPEQIRREATRMVIAGAPGGRYVAAVNTIVGREVPLENYLAFIDAVDRAGRYPEAFEA